MRVELTNVGHQFGSGPLLFDKLTLTLVPGQVYALVGPSGSGKSTLLSILAGWLTPARGEVAKEGVKRTAWVFQNPHGVAGRTALDHVVLPYLAQGIRRSEAEELARARLADFDLASTTDRPFRELSGGEAQRLMLARGLASNPQLFLVDEPTAQLDRVAAETVNDSLHAMSASTTIVVIATHDQQTRDRCTEVIDLGRFR